MNEFEHPGVNAVILDALTENEGFQSILDRLAERFNVTVTVMNLDGTQVIHSGTGDDRNAELSVPTGVFTDRTPLWYELPDSRFCQVCPVVSGEQPYGAVLVTCSDAGLRETAAAIGEAAARIYRFFFHLGDENQEFNFQNHIIARLLLLESSFTRLEGFTLSDLSEYTASGMKFCPQFAVAVFCQAAQESEQLPANAISLVPRYIPNCFCLRDGQRILALIYGLEGDGIRNGKTLYTALNAFCDYTGLICGVSDIFPELDNRRAYIRQAMALAKTRPQPGRQRVILAEEEFGKAILFGVMEQIDGRVFLLSDIERLARYDEEHRTEYLKTLESYLLSAGHYTQASRQLFIDRGTLKYRLEKIRKIISCDPDDPAASRRLLGAIRMREVYQSRREM